MKGIEAFQIKKIYAIGNALGIVENGNKDDNLHTLIGNVTGKDSVKELTYNEANVIISQLEQLQGKVAPPKKSASKKHEAVPGGVTEAQQRKVWALLYELKKYDKEPSTAAIGDRLCGIIRKELKVDSMVKNPFAWLDFSSGNKLIEILKKYVSSAKKQMR